MPEVSCNLRGSGTRCESLCIAGVVWIRHTKNKTPVVAKQSPHGSGMRGGHLCIAGMVWFRHTYTRSPL